MKIAIVGPGAIGLLLAAFLSKAKEELWLLDYEKNRANRISQNGIKVEGLSGELAVKVKITVDPKEIGIVDLVIVCVKSYDTKAALIHAKPLIGDDTAVLTLQNGIGNIEIISEVIGPDRVIGGVTNLGSTLIDTCRVRLAGKGDTIIGRLDGKIPVEMRGIREIFNKVGLEMRISRDVKSLLWSKLIINVGVNALTALTRLQNGKLLEFEGTRVIMRDAVTEAVKVAKRKRIKIMYDDPLAKVEAVCEATSANVSSMLQDVVKHRRTEIDFINGVIVRHAKEQGVSAPVNSLLVELVKTIEASYGKTI